ncbi:MAG: dTDP-4-dehydrorhamnose 3,5-epimerase [bacterium]
MIFQQARIKGVYILEPEFKIDQRGYFSRIFCESEFKKNGLNFKIIQANQSLTKKRGTIRGMHFQEEPNREKKIVQCLKGAAYDVIVDLREDSSTFGQWIIEKLDEENKKMLYVPEGVAHGFQSMTDNCLMQYFMSNHYSPEDARGVRWDDPFLKIKWPIDNPLLSEKDKKWPLINSKQQ